MKELVCSHLSIPQPGARTDLSLETPNEGFKFDYERLIVNRDPMFNGTYLPTQPYEYFASRILPELYQNLESGNADNFIQFIKLAFTSYITRKSQAILFFAGQDVPKAAIEQFLRKVDLIGIEANQDNKQILWIKDQVKMEMASLYERVFSPKDEENRDEGHLHTLIVIVAGLIDDVGEFREQFKARHDLCHPQQANTLTTTFVSSLS